MAGTSPCLAAKLCEKEQNRDQRAIGHLQSGAEADRNFFVTYFGFVVDAGTDGWIFGLSRRNRPPSR